MWATLALTAAKIGLSFLAPKATGVLADVTKIAETALPIVENIANNHAGSNTVKYNTAVKQVTAISGSGIKEHVIESGVQLAYSLLKAKMDK